MSREEYRQRLVCGTAVPVLVNQVADRLLPSDAEHQQSCVHCRSTLAELDKIWLAVHRLAAEPITVPPGFTAKVRRGILEPLLPAGPAGPTPTPRPQAWVRLPTRGRGATRMGDTALARLARLAAGSVPGVATPALGRSSGAGVSLSDDHITVSLQIQARYGDDLVATAEAVRMAVAVQLLAVAGLDDVTIHVRIVGFTDA